ncbi:MAG TPA: hypothetical protein VN868_07455 [Terriglobales bacterium]|nr:hypothetical protein [Terriglobales bacterium]
MRAADHRYAARASKAVRLRITKVFTIRQVSDRELSMRARRSEQQPTYLSLAKPFVPAQT